MDDRRQPAPDFTNAFLTSLFVIVLSVLFAVWAVWGLLAAFALGYAADRVLGLRRRRA